MESSTVAVGNEEAVQAWDGVLFDRFKQYRHIFTTGLGAHSDAAMALHPPPAGGRVIDIGCGFGDTTQQLAQLVGPEGEAVGIDAAPNFIELSIKEAEEAGVENVRFEVLRPAGLRARREVRLRVLAHGRDVLRQPGRRHAEHPQDAEPGRQDRLVRLAAEGGQPLDRARRGDRPRSSSTTPTPRTQTSRPAGRARSRWATRTRSANQLTIAGFEDISFYRSDKPITVGGDVEEALEVVTSLGPAGEILRLAGEKADPVRPQIDEKLREMYVEYTDPDGAVRAPASVWIVSARVPG